MLLFHNSMAFREYQNYGKIFFKENEKLLSKFIIYYIFPVEVRPALLNHYI